jgi:hypothetical protein
MELYFPNFYSFMLGNLGINAAGKLTVSSNTKLTVADTGNTTGIAFTTGADLATDKYTRALEGQMYGPVGGDKPTEAAGNVDITDMTNGSLLKGAWGVSQQ